MNYAKANSRQANVGYDYGNYDYDYTAGYNSPQYQNMLQGQNQNSYYQNSARQQGGVSALQQRLYKQRLQGGQTLQQGTSGYGGRGGAAYGQAGLQSGTYGQSGYGSSGPQAAAKSGTYGAYSGGYNDCPGVPLALLLITALGIITMGVLFYLKVVAAGRRRRREADSWWSIEALEVAVAAGRSPPPPASYKWSGSNRELRPGAGQTGPIPQLEKGGRGSGEPRAGG
jgi:hypothetical protein